ncbi:DUF3789 domain-containing protein [Megamonas funiformis]
MKCVKDLCRLMKKVSNMFILGLIIGGCIGVMLMCILQINRR